MLEPVQYLHNMPYFAHKLM